MMQSGALTHPGTTRKAAALAEEDFYQEGTVDETTLVHPAPGEEPRPFDDASRYVSDTELAVQIKALGSPSVSDLIALPLKKGGSR